MEKIITMKYEIRSGLVLGLKYKNNMFSAYAFSVYNIKEKCGKTFIEITMLSMETQF